MRFSWLNRGSWAFAALAPLIVLAPRGASAQTELPLPPKGVRASNKKSAVPTTAAPYKIAIPERLRKKGTKIRIENKATGQKKIITLEDEEFISSDAVRELMDPKTQAFKPQFSVLEIEKRRRPTAGREANPTVQQLTNSLIFDQPVWREIPFKAGRLKQGAILFKLGGEKGRILGPARIGQATGGVAATVTSLPVPSPEEAARRRALQEGGDVKKLFDIGWRSLNAKRYDLGLLAFSKVLDKKEYISAEQLTQAALGHGLCRFHQEGCGRIEEDFRIAERDPKNTEDVSYFRGLCAVENKMFREADLLFKELVKSQSAKYGESSRFFVGVVAENEERYDDAEAAYLDTVDFSSDAKLVGLAKARMEAVKGAKLQKEFREKWLLVALTGSLGYDSNVVNLPQGLAPGAYSLTNEAAPTTMGLGYFEIKPPWTRAADLKIKYTYLALHYLSTQISKSSDIQSHGLGLGSGFTATERDHVGLGVDYNVVMLGPMATSKEFMGTTSLSFDWSSVFGALDAPTADLSVSSKVGFLRPTAKAAISSVDTTANSYALSTRYNFKHIAGHVFGPGLDFEYHPAIGSENTLYSATLIGRWDSPVGPETWQLTASQELDLQYSSYFKSSTKRTDEVARYTGSVARLWTPYLETRLQMVGTLSLSSVKALYQYQKLQFNLLVSAFF